MLSSSRKLHRVNVSVLKLAMITDRRNKSSGIIELRSYTAKPERTKDYAQMALGSADIRTKYCGDNWKLFLSAECGYGSLSDFVHVYTYDDLSHRAAARKAMAADPAWQSFLLNSRSCLQDQKSEIFVPANIAGLDFKYFSADASMGPVSSYCSFSPSFSHAHTIANTYTRTRMRAHLAHTYIRAHAYIHTFTYQYIRKRQSFRH